MWERNVDVEKKNQLSDNKKMVRLWKKIQIF